MTARLLGGALLLAGGLLTRHALLGGARRERNALRELAALCLRIDREISLCLTPLPQILALRGAGACADAFLAAVQTGLSAGGTFEESWRAAAAALPLAEAERTRFAALGCQLTGEAERAHRTLCAAADELSASLRTREAERAEREKLVTACCFCGSVFLLVLLL